MLLHCQEESVKNKDNNQLRNIVLTYQRFLRTNIERLKCLDVSWELIWNLKNYGILHNVL